MEELINAVKAHAVKNYETGGWDYAVECFEDSDIADIIRSCETPAQAIERVGSVVDAMNERRAGALAEIF